MSRNFYRIIIKSDKIYKRAIEHNMAIMQNEYFSINVPKFVENNLNTIREVKENDIIILEKNGKIYAWGYAIKPRKYKHKSDKIEYLNFNDMIDNIFDVDGVKYISGKYKGIIYFKDCECFYNNLTEILEKSKFGGYCWGQRIDIDKWRCHSEDKGILPKNFDLEENPSDNIYKIKEEIALRIIKELTGDIISENNKFLLGNYIELLMHNKNLILTGAPGTGKTYLAKQIANEMIKGETDKNPDDIIRNYYEEYKNELEEYFNECERLRQEFIKKFPKETLKSISIDDYCLGGEDKDAFCNWIEFKLKNSGYFNVPFSTPYLLYKNKKEEIINTAEEKDNNKLIKEIGEAIYKMATEKDYNGDLKFHGHAPKFAMKIYNSYNGYEYFPIFAKSYMDKLCEIFNIPKDNNVYNQNINIKKYFENNFNDIKLVIIKEILVRNFDLKNGIVNKNNNGMSLEGKIGFVQFHPSYDYTDFVEGLRPIQDEKGDIVFERKDGVFKEFCKEALNNQSSNFVFIIDEINRGEISKIFGELFFSVDSGYRGEKGKVLTQYANLIEDGDEFKDGFYIPENVYIIGTMNDIDRSVESMDFAMRRRFAWKEIKAEDTQETILSDLGDLKYETIKRMDNLNNVIRDEETNLSEAYCIGAAYFKKIKDYKGDFNKLWDNHLNGLLFEYTRGMSNQNEIIEKLKNAYKSNNNENKSEEENTIVK